MIIYRPEKQQIENLVILDVPPTENNQLRN